ncbi:hypothetical protein A3D03_00600 [Candidatus Gottesmanbacteria bacterium RIFCSPHIGHO2_02_FULL_40_13]|uniref:GIY-YIG domain-containing protein n=1 Tax=Candidatus Gottesmanbacteria bacterium RIFCSPHIGHO2_02_FULL_40_13 TaxID=1798384 RepID=A0A1F6A7B6_9BACT|nr:MAG: hypothetical protein A3D03_00600 [Candidatus Gottesmanbacteria bacterium RIFCSPHIGHO2_02_FULL_40_13]
MKSQKNGKVYVGSTEKEPQDRVREHNQGSNTWSKYNGPFILKYFEKYHCKRDVLNRESFYKTGIGKQVKYAIVEKININIGD